MSRTVIIRVASEGRVWVRGYPQTTRKVSVIRNVVVYGVPEGVSSTDVAQAIYERVFHAEFGQISERLTFDEIKERTGNDGR